MARPRSPPSALLRDCLLLGWGVWAGDVCVDWIYSGVCVDVAGGGVLLLAYLLFALVD